MGTCCAAPSVSHGSSQEQINDANISRQMKSEQEKRSHHIILLGAGDSGKTTLLKQMRKIYGASDKMPGAEEQMIREAVIGYIRTLCKQSMDLNVAIDEKNEEHRNFFINELSPSYAEHFTVQNVARIKALWSDRGIQETYERRREYQFADNVDYFFDDRLDEIASKRYEVSFDDFVRVRVRTTGFVSEKFYKDIKDATHEFVFTDVGGQRSERSKWMNMVHEDIDVVLYVVAISEYDLVCFEDGTTKRLDEALSLFQKVMDHGFCTGKTVTLFFNKFDLFAEKLKDPNAQTIDQFHDDFPADKDARNADDVVEYIYNRFVTVYSNALPENTNVPHCHRTSAVHTEQINMLMKDIEGDLVRGRLLTIGF